MSLRMVRRQIPLFITFILGMVLTADWFLVWEPLKESVETLQNFAIIISAFMSGYAAVNLFIIHSRVIRRNLKEKRYFEPVISIILLLCLVVWSVIGVGLGRTSSTYRWLYNNFNLPLSSTAYAATLFYLASATYRVLRARSTETAILLIVGGITIMSNMPLFVKYIPPLLSFRTWISDVLVKASYRAILIGVGLGGILMSMRTMLGMETGYLGAREE